MLVGRINKQPLQISRFTVNFNDGWLDQGETIESVTDVNITEVATGWVGPWPWNPGPYFNNSNTGTQTSGGQPPPGALPPGQGPLVLYGTYVILQSQYVQIFVEKGVPGQVYQVQFVVTGTSTRAIPVEVLVQVQGP